MNDEITQCFKKIFPISNKIITDLLEKLSPSIKKTFPIKRRHGKKRIMLKKVLAAIFYRVKVGCPWRQLPDFFGN